MAVLGYLLKLKGGLGLAFGAQFLHDFSTNNFLFNTLSTVTLWGSRQIFSTKYIYIQQNVNRRLYCYICRNLHLF